MAKPVDIPEDAFHPVAQDFDKPTPEPSALAWEVGPEVLRLPIPPPEMPPRDLAPEPPVVVTVKPKPRPKPVVIKRITRTTYPSVADAKAYALSRIGSTQFACLDKLFTRESNWNPHDYNRSSGAYGIPQALPGTKMATAGADWRDNPVTQVKWGLSYIAGRYGSACNAWAHSQTYNWY